VSKSQSTRIKHSQYYNVESSMESFASTCICNNSQIVEGLNFVLGSLMGKMPPRSIIAEATVTGPAYMTDVA
jgi:hypothetical protein